MTWGELNRETALHGLATTGGVVSTTGIAGLTLGGGLGWLNGVYGLAVDNLLSVELVTAGGDVLTVTEETDPDLFWALRGGGGNFGVATWFEYRLHPLKEVFGGLVAHPFENAGDVCARFAISRSQMSCGSSRDSSRSRRVGGEDGCARGLPRWPGRAGQKRPKTVARARVADHVRSRPDALSRGEHDVR